jgi:hypothetical protein
LKKRLAIAAAILTIATGCDKAKETASRALGREAKAPAAAPVFTGSLNLQRGPRPDILFQVFGDRAQPRMIPIASIDGGNLSPIVMPPQGWRLFDSTYTRSGASYAVYQDGVQAGTLRVRRGMWEKPDSALYQLPNCKVLTPLASVQLGDAAVRSGSTVELLASTKALGRASSARTVRSTAIDERVRRIGYLAAGKKSLGADELAPLSFRALSIPTSAGGRTLVGTYIDNQSREGIDRRKLPRITQLLFLADSLSYGYNLTYSSGGTARADSLRLERYVDHLDMDGDGFDEILLDAWTFDETSFPVVLKFRNGAWVEIFRGRASWCAEK